MQFSSRLLLIVTTFAAILAYCLTFLSQTTFLISIVPVPSAIALTCRYSLNRSHGTSSIIGFISSVMIGATMMAWGSYDKTFNKGNVGFLVGGGWSSVAAAAIFGAFAGACCGTISMMLYYLVTLGTDSRFRSASRTPDNKAVNPSRR